MDLAREKEREDAMLKNKVVGFVGTGNMGEALVHGILHGRL